MLNLVRRVRGGSAIGRQLQTAWTRNASTLIVAEHDNSTLSPSSLSAVTAAQELKREVTLLVIGHKIQGVVEQVGECSQRLVLVVAI